MKTTMVLLIVLTSLAVGDLLPIPAEAGETLPKPPKAANLRIDVSAALIEAAVQRSVDQTEPFEDVIQETPVHGIARSIGKVEAELVPDTARASVDVVFRGCVWAQSVGVRPNVLFCTFTTTPLEVRRRVSVDRTGIRTFLGPCCAESTCQLLGIKSRTCPEGITIKIAERMYQQAQAASEAETAAKTAGRVSGQLGDELTPILFSASQAVGRQLKEFQRSGLSVETLDFSTTAGFVQARARIVGKGMSEPSASPALPADIDLGIRVHESLPNASAQAQFGGRSFRLEEVSDIYDEATRGLLLDGRKDKAKRIGLKKLGKDLAKLAGKPVTITFAQKDPFTTVFADQEVTVECRIASIRQEGVVYAGQRLKVVYRLEHSKEGVHAVRQGRVQILPGEAPAKDKKAAPLPLQFRLAQDVLNDEVFKERLTLASLPLPEGLESVRLQAPRAAAGNGWLTFTWKLAN